jgi:hypothetical protein
MADGARVFRRAGQASGYEKICEATVEAFRAA